MESLDLRTMVQSHSWTWLLDLGRHLNVAIDIVDDECVPLLPIEGSDTSDDHAALRSLLSTESSPLRSTIAIATPSTSHAVAIDHQLCICHGLSHAGTLVVARKMKAGGAEDSRLELESIGIWLAAAIDGSLSNGAFDAIADSHLVGSLRRLLDDAVARESTRGVVSAFVETLAVWLEIEVHGYVAGAPGRFLLSLSPVGTDHSTVPAALDDDVVPAGTAMVRLSSSETERFEFTSVPDDVLIRRIAAHGSASWVMVFAGTIDRSAEARLTVLSDLCRDALNTLTVEPVVTPEVEVAEHESPAAAPSSDQGERRSAHRPFHAWIERLASQTIEEGGHASVIVISIPDEDARPEYSRLRSSRSETSCAPRISPAASAVARLASCCATRLPIRRPPYRRVWKSSSNGTSPPARRFSHRSAWSAARRIRSAKDRSCGPRVKTAPRARCASAGAISWISWECLDSYGRSCKMARRPDGPGHISHTLSHTAAQRPSFYLRRMIHVRSTLIAAQPYPQRDANV